MLHSKRSRCNEKARHHNQRMRPAHQQESWLLEAAWVWVAEAPGAKRPGRGAAAAKQLGSLARVPGGRSRDSGWVFMGNGGMSCPQKLLPGSLRILMQAPPLFPL